MGVFGLILAILYTAHLGVGKIQYLRQKPILPQTPATFSLGYQVGDRTKFVEVQRKGALTKWKQTVDGVPAFDTVVTTKSNGNGMINRMEGFIADEFKPIKTTPIVSADVAVDVLKIHSNHKGLTNVEWLDVKPELYLLSKNKTNELVWLVSYGVEQKEAAAVENGFGKHTSEVSGFVNAHTGKVESTWKLNNNAEIPAITGNDKIGENKVQINVSRIDDDCWHLDEDRRVKVYTMNHFTFSERCGQAEFKCKDAQNKNWDEYNSTGGYSPRNDVYDSAVKFIDLWRELVGTEIEPYESKYSYLQLCTHFGNNTDDAQFRRLASKFFFGDGREKFYPLTSLDIVCHEIGHGVTAWKGAKLDRGGEAGAINEAYSDMLGETCDMHFKGRDNYLIGADVMKPGKGKAMRDMCDPPSLGTGDLDNYTNYTKSTDRYQAAGIYNKAWCLLSQTSGWNYIKAFKVFTDANLMSWNQRSTMHCGACAVENRAADLELDKFDVRAAFKKVGVECCSCEKSLAQVDIELFE